MVTVVLGSILACSGSDDTRVFETRLPQELDPPVPVVLRDKTGLVTAIGPADVAELEQWAPTVHQDPSDSNAFVVTWMAVHASRTSRCT